jgi:asparagine synthase (glutamine-hydrolysing)
MCGLAGFLLRSPGPQAEALGTIVNAMAERLRLRGPDDSGAWTDAGAGVALGFRRLAIIDLSPAGHQPMISADGRFAIAFNGEIYNFRALRAELAALGTAFRGGSDTEVIVEAVARWGIGPAIERLNGMFAIALWDRQRRELTLVRDRLGIKPLYWGWQGDVLFFASQPKAFAAHPAWAPKLDRNALRAFFRFAYVPAPLSIWEGIAKLEPGCMVTLDAGGGIEHRRYWDLLAQATQPADDAMSDGDAVAQLSALLEDAVSGQMVSDVPIGAFLSGGVDSSTVAALMQRASPRPIRTFTIGFEAVGYDESDAARAVARHIGSDHVELVAQPQDALDLAPHLAEHYDEPFADASQIPTCLVSHLTRQHVTVALSGDGGDEGFAGYNRYEAQRLWQRLSVLPAPMRRLFASAVLSVAPGRWDSLFSTFGSSLPLAGSKMHKFARIATADSIQELYGRLVSQWQEPGQLVPDGIEPRGPLDDRRLPNLLPDPLQRLQYLDLSTYLPDDILTKVDRASMAYSLEARVPLLDHRVVEFALRQPSHRKQRQGRGKWLLRQVLYRHVPPELVDRPKAGFAVPIDAWLRGPLRDWAEDLLSEKSLAVQGLVAPGPVRQAWADHLSGRRNLHYPLWCVLMAQSWHRRWMA